MRQRAFALLCLLLATGGCTPPPSAAPAAKRWDSMSSSEKNAYMVDVVTPRMKEIFVAFDRHRFAKLGCPTCHGAEGAEQDFVMPCPDLLLEPTPWNTGPASPEGAPSRFDAFMARDVTPEMAKLLGREPASAGAGGFGCFGCHAPER